MDWKPERERRALAKLAVDAQIAAEELGQPSRDGEPEPGAALHRLTARTGVHLFEFFKDARLIVRCDADGDSRVAPG